MSRIIALCFVLFAETASADVMLKFNDGTANVWESYYGNGTQYCTKKSFGEYCVFKKDVISIKEVPAGTEASVYGISTGGLDQDTMDSIREETANAQKRLSCASLKAAKKTNTNEYRRDCYTPEQKAARNEQVRRNNEQRKVVNVPQGTDLPQQGNDMPPQLTPNGGYVSGGSGMTLCPDGSYVAGSYCVLAPNGRYVSQGNGMPPQLTPNGGYVSGGSGMTLCPDGSYVAGSYCVLAPNGRYVGR